MYTKTTANPASANKASPSIYLDTIQWLTWVDVSALNWWTFVANDHILVQWFYKI